MATARDPRCRLRAYGSKGDLVRGFESLPLRFRSPAAIYRHSATEPAKAPPFWSAVARMTTTVLQSAGRSAGFGALWSFAAVDPRAIVAPTARAPSPPHPIAGRPGIR